MAIALGLHKNKDGWSVLQFAKSISSIKRQHSEKNTTKQKKTSQRIRNEENKRTEAADEQPNGKQYNTEKNELKID